MSIKVPQTCRLDVGDPLLSPKVRVKSSCWEGVEVPVNLSVCVCDVPVSFFVCIWNLN